MSQEGRVLAVCTSQKKGVPKRDAGRAELRADWGIVGDAHAANWHRQVNLLAWESIEKMGKRPTRYCGQRSTYRAAGVTPALHPSSGGGSSSRKRWTSSPDPLCRTRAAGSSRTRRSPSCQASSPTRRSTRAEQSAASK